MKNLSQAIYAKAIASTALWSSVGGRVYKMVTPDILHNVYPHIIFKMVYDNTNENTFQEEIEDVLYQFSIFSNDNSADEAEDIYTLLKAAFDKCDLTVTGNTFLHMLRQQATLFQDEIQNPNGTGWVWHYAVDYEILMQKD